MTKKKKPRHPNRKQKRLEKQVSKKQRKKPKTTPKVKLITDFTHALSHVTTNEETNQRLIKTKCEFPIIHSKIIDEETELMTVRKTPLVIKRNKKVTCPNCKKRLDNFLVAFRKRRMRKVRNFFYRVSLIRLPKLNIMDKRREKKRLRLLAEIEDEAIDSFVDKMVKGVKNWTKFVEKHLKDRYDEYLDLSYYSYLHNNDEVEEEEVFLSEDLLDEGDLLDEEDQEVDDVSGDTEEDQEIDDINGDTEEETTEETTEEESEEESEEVQELEETLKKESEDIEEAEKLFKD